MERTILVCDVCGHQAVETAVINAGNGNLFKDLCQQHVTTLLNGARRPRRGRKVGTMLDTLQPTKRLGRPKGSKNKPKETPQDDGAQSGGTVAQVEETAAA